MSANVSRTNDIEFTSYAKQQIAANEQQSQRLRANSSLPPEAWESLDDTLYDTFDNTLRVVQDLRAAGLTTTESIYTRQSTWDLLAGEHEASVDMDPETETDEGAVTFGRDGVPMPIVHDDWSIGFRDEAPEANRAGGGLENLNAEESSRAVAEKLERLALYGHERFQGGRGYDLYGLANHPDSHTGDLGDWETDPNSARQDVRAMMDAIESDEIYPGNSGYWLYFSRDLAFHLDDFDEYGEGDTTIGERLGALDAIGGIRTSDYLEPGTALMFAPQSNVVDLAVAQEESMIQWENPLRTSFKTLACMVPRVKTTHSGQSGIAVYSQA